MSPTSMSLVFHLGTKFVGIFFSGGGIERIENFYEATQTDRHPVTFTSMAPKPINIHWIRTGSQTY